MSPWFGREQVKRAHQQVVSDLHGTSDILNANLSSLELPVLDCSIQLYAGTEEMRTINDVHYQALHKWQRVTSIRPPSGHNIFDPSYLQALEKNAPLLVNRRA